MYFYQIVLPVLIQIADDNPNVRIILIGEVDQRSARSSHENIKWIQPKNYSEYLNILHNAHISIAPLEINGATDCKSELKWLEGTMLEIAMVVSPTHAYREVLSDEEDVLFASNSNQWYDQLNRLVRDSVLRKKLVYNSKLKADLLFNQSINISSWNNILRELCVIGSSSD